MNRIRHCSVLAFFIVALTGCHRDKAADKNLPVPPTASSVTNNTVRFQELLGRWLRPDGGYILEVASVEKDGRATARYLNPRPINVSQARAVWEGPQLRLFVELRDTGYPGSTYTLTYQPAQKQLVGEYFQAAMNETYQIVFVRADP